MEQSLSVDEMLMGTTSIEEKAVGLEAEGIGCVEDLPVGYCNPFDK